MKEQAPALVEVEANGLVEFGAILDHAARVESHLNACDFEESELCKVVSSSVDELNELSEAYVGQRVICRGMFNEYFIDENSIITKARNSTGIVEGEFLGFYPTQSVMGYGDQESASYIQLQAVIKVREVSMPDEEGRPVPNTVVAHAPVGMTELSLSEDYEANLLDQALYDLREQPETLNRLVEIFTTDNLLPFMPEMETIFEDLQKSAPAPLVDAALTAINSMRGIYGRRFIVHAPHYYQVFRDGNTHRLEIESEGAQGDCLGFTLMWLPLSEDTQELCLSFSNQRQIFHVPVGSISNVRLPDELLPN